MRWKARAQWVFLPHRQRIDEAPARNRPSGYRLRAGRRQSRVKHAAHLSDALIPGERRALCNKERRSTRHSERITRADVHLNPRRFRSAVKTRVKSRGVHSKLRRRRLEVRNGRCIWHRCAAAVDQQWILVLENVRLELEELVLIEST